MAEAHVYLLGCEYRPPQGRRAITSQVRFAVHHPGGEWRSVAGVRQLGLSFSFTDLVVIEPNDMPNDIPWEEVRGAIARYFAHQVETAVTEASDGGPVTPMSITETTRDDFDAHGMEWRYLGTMPGAKPDDDEKGTT